MIAAMALGRTFGRTLDVVAVLVVFSGVACDGTALHADFPDADAGSRDAHADSPDVDAGFPDADAGSLDAGSTSDAQQADGESCWVDPLPSPVSSIPPRSAVSDSCAI